MSPSELKELFKDTLGRWKTCALFEETCEDPAKYPPVYCLGDSDTSSCVSLKRLYLELRDVTEYQFANMYLGGWDHWQRIVESYRLKPHIEAWRSELDLLLRTEYLAAIRELSGSETATGLAATKYLLETTTTFGGEKKKRGRPSKQEVEGELKQQARSAKEIAEDAKRIGIKVVK